MLARAGRFHGLLPTLAPNPDQHPAEHRSLAPQPALHAQQGPARAGAALLRPADGLEPGQPGAAAPRAALGALHRLHALLPAQPERLPPDGGPHAPERGRGRAGRLHIQLHPGQLEQWGRALLCRLLGSCYLAA